MGAHDDTGVIRGRDGALWSFAVAASVAWISGALAGLVYTPTPDDAAASLAHVERSVTGGSIVLAIHRSAGTAAAIGVVVHLVLCGWSRVAGWAWGRALLLSLLTLGLTQTGAVLPWGEGGRGSMRVAVELLRACPGGEGLARLWVGADELGRLVLLRSHLLHAVGLPALVAGVLVSGLTRCWRRAAFGGVAASALVAGLAWMDLRGGDLGGGLPPLLLPARAFLRLGPTPLVLASTALAAGLLVAWPGWSRRLPPRVRGAVWLAGLTLTLGLGAFEWSRGADRPPPARSVLVPAVDQPFPTPDSPPILPAESRVVVPGSDHRLIGGRTPREAAVWSVASEGCLACHRWGGEGDLLGRGGGELQGPGREDAEWWLGRLLAPDHRPFWEPTATGGSAAARSLAERLARGAEE